MRRNLDQSNREVFLSFFGQVCLHCSSIDEQYVFVRVCFAKNLYVRRNDFFLALPRLYQYTTQHSGSCPLFFVFCHTSQADCGVGDMNPYVHH